LALVLGNRAVVPAGGSQAISTHGFNAPCPTGGGTGCDGSITFIVNTGLNVDDVTMKIKGSVAGTYTDTLKFTLLAHDY